MLILWGYREGQPQATKSQGKRVIVTVIGPQTDA
jgi:hypothetical protein